MNDEKNNSSPKNQIQSLWIGGDLSTMERLSAQSFIDKGQEYHLYTYGSVGNIPPGVIIKDGNEILDKSEIFTYKNGSYSAFSNLFRFTLLEKRGGYWADTDLICVRSLKPLEEEDIVIVSEPSATYSEEVIPTSCFIKLPKGSEIAKEGIRIQREHKRLIQRGRLTWSSGPTTVKHIVNKFGLKDKILNWKAVCSCSWADARSIVEPNRRYNSAVIQDYSKIPHEMYCIHLWNEVWRRNGLDKNGTYNNSSIYETLKRTISI